MSVPCQVPLVMVPSVVRLVDPVQVVGETAAQAVRFAASGWYVLAAVAAVRASVMP